MKKRIRTTRKKQKGGFFGLFDNSSQSGMTQNGSWSDWFSGLTSKAKESTSGFMNSANSTIGNVASSASESFNSTISSASDFLNKDVSLTNNTTQQGTTQQSYVGGKRRVKTRRTNKRRLRTRKYRNNSKRI